MRAQLVLVIITAAAISSGCTTEDYYRSANRSSELRTSINLDAIDTIKTSAVSQKRTFLLPVEASDENGNMNTLTTFADGGETQILGGLGEGATEAIELAKERYAFTRQVEFTPTVDGRHTINARVRDDFGNVTSMEKMVYSFTNMRPKLKIGHYAYRNLTGDLLGVNHIIDFAASYDRDKKWDGDIDSLFVLFGGTGDDGYVTSRNAKKISDYRPDISGVHIDTFILNVEAGLYDDGDWWWTDFWVWVKDNESMPDLMIELKSEKLKEKSSNPAHLYNISEVKDLPKAVNNPLVVFTYGDRTKAVNLITEIEHNGKNFLVGISLNPAVKGERMSINDIRNVFPKDTHEWVNWINQGKGLYYNKEKVLNFLDQQRINPAEVAFGFPENQVQQENPKLFESLLDSTTNIVQNFQNSKLTEEKNTAIAKATPSEALKRAIDSINNTQTSEKQLNALNQTWKNKP